mmetsp:Transcript_102572/g.221348  ORF Transcript_102572/g.221348 Transcript_102572/m.221348 type:complete len:257 (+) Transcript_102572:283-1053(+)
MSNSIDIDKIDAQDMNIQVSVTVIENPVEFVCGSTLVPSTVTQGSECSNSNIQIDTADIVFPNLVDLKMNTSIQENDLNQQGDLDLNNNMFKKDSHSNRSNHSNNNTKINENQYQNRNKNKQIISELKLNRNELKSRNSFPKPVAYSMLDSIKYAFSSLFFGNQSQQQLLQQQILNSAIKQKFKYDENESLETRNTNGLVQVNQHTSNSSTSPINKNPDSKRRLSRSKSLQKKNCSEPLSSQPHLQSQSNSVFNTE